MTTAPRFGQKQISQLLYITHDVFRDTYGCQDYNRHPKIEQSLIEHSYRNQEYGMFLSPYHSNTSDAT